MDFSKNNNNHDIRREAALPIPLLVIRGLSPPQVPGLDMHSQPGNREPGEGPAWEAPAVPLIKCATCDSTT